MLNPRTCKALELLIKLSALVFYDYLYLEARSFTCLPLFGVRLHVNNILMKIHLFSFVPTIFNGICELVCFIRRQRNGCFGAKRSEQMG